MKFRFLFLAILILTACDPNNSNSSLGTDVGNAVDGSATALTEVINDGAEEAALGVVSVSTDSDNTTALSRQAGPVRVFPNSFRRGAGRFSQDCPNTRVRVIEDGFRVRRLFENCRPRRSVNSIFNGVEITTITRLSDDADSNDQVNRLGNIIRNFRTTLGTGATIETSESSTFEAEGSFPNIEHNSSGTYRRVIRGSGGRRLQDVDVTSDLNYEMSGEDGIDEVVLNGSSTISRNLLNATVTATYNNVTWNESCRHPIAGSINLIRTRANGSSTSHIARYDASCGSIIVDNNSVRLLE